MALGMADVIQKNAGSVHLDTMFIDEGFGSLDEDARGKAIQILQELAGESRLIGIISHVTEMKEQMDRKLVISKGKNGSFTQWQVES
jgi:exonuclease SbcC